ncbi:hypothetical protein [Clostridium cellulovorans]|uniref:DUF1232 domain-containing protein n=1 Tax=Clostridium cellulovorans (strain ATCC 35296 / DSM 3052 / OCM 3 / 743B) TaxID=573061 RepID=D9SQR9_CLOC7|nr:hypothetical protein [Clostridium cellulovorans]ADL52275.1 hypothetical protein Clocel_2563 [Clostridium cellulovorans 743B]
MEEMKTLDSTQYSKVCSEKVFLSKVIKNAEMSGVKATYARLILFNTLQKPFTPKWAKTIIINALGDFATSISKNPNTFPVPGSIDDLRTLALALVAVDMFIDTEVKQKSKLKLKEEFQEYDESLIEDIDNRI